MGCGGRHPVATRADVEPQFRFSLSVQATDVTSGQEWFVATDTSRTQSEMKVDSLRSAMCSCHHRLTYADPERRVFLCNVKQSILVKQNPLFEKSTLPS